LRDGLFFCSYPDPANSFGKGRPEAGYHYVFINDIDPYCPFTLYNGIAQKVDAKPRLGKNVVRPVPEFLPMVILTTHLVGMSDCLTTRDLRFIFWEGEFPLRKLWILLLGSMQKVFHLVK
jgi:hypothetical protein